MSRYVHAVHIVCSVYNGERYLEAFVQSLQAQTVGNWLLWVRDDGSRDSSVSLLARLANRDQRIQLLRDPSGATPQNLGVVGSFDAVLQRVPAEARYIMFADQDDVWLPEKIEYALSAMTLGEQTTSGPLLVHSDMRVVDGQLQPMAESFWEFARINPEQTSLRQLLARNVVTGATMMINRGLRERVGTIPSGAAMHDWWIACVASAFGELIAISTPTMLYRQHDSNVLGAVRPGSSASATEFPGAAARAMRRTARLRNDIANAARQAAEFVRRYGTELEPEDRAFADAYAGIPALPFMRRKLRVARLHLQRDDGWMKNVGLLLRA
ncbi:MAG: glycosyltransferase family 2 protein [Gemmatimonas sp.]